MKSILLIGLICLNICAFAQIQTENRWSCNASIYSLNLCQKGLKLGAERNFSTKEKIKSNGKEKHIYKSMYNGFNLGYYELPKTSNNYFVEATIGHRRIGQKNFIHGVELGLMIIRSYNYGNTYNVSENGDVDEIYLAGNIYAAPKLNYMFGYNFKNNFQVGLKPGLFLQFGHYKSFVPQFTLETSLSYKF